MTPRRIYLLSVRPAEGGEASTRAFGTEARLRAHVARYYRDVEWFADTGTTQDGEAFRIQKVALQIRRLPIH